MSTKTQWPTPTGEQAQQHPALALADKVSAEIVRTVELDVMHNDAANTIRRLHALVVQMREALWIAVEHDRLWHGDNHNTMLTGMPALTAANDYLKGQQ